MAGTTAIWCCTTRRWRKARAGSTPFSSDRNCAALTRVRSASGVYPAVNALVTLAGEVKSIVGGDTIVTYGADWTEYGAHVVDNDANEVRFPLDPLWASPSIDCVGIDYYAPLSDWRDDANALDRALSDSPYRRDYLAGRLNSGEAYDWYYADDAARASQTRSAITDGLGKPWVFRQKDIWNFWSQRALRARRWCRARQPDGLGAARQADLADRDWLPGASTRAPISRARFPIRSPSEAGLPYFSNGKRDDPDSTALP